MSKTATPRGVVDGQAPPSQEQAAPATPTDWEAIERAFRAGLLSIREIAKQHGITDKAIRNKAKRNQWARDLTAKVQEAVRTELVRTAVRTANARTTERQIIEEAKAGPVQAVQLHRRDVRFGQELAYELLAQLREAAANREALEQAVYEDTPEADDQNPDARNERIAAQQRRNAMLKAIALPAHAVVLRDLGTAMSKFIPLERQAYSITSSPDEPPPADETVTVTDASLEAFAAKLDKVLGKQAE